MVSPNNQQEMNENQQQQENEKTMYVFSKDSNFRKFVISIVINKYFRGFNLFLIVITSVRIALVTPVVDPNSIEAQILQQGFYVLTVLYCLILIFNLIAFGLKGYLRFSHYNVLSLLITIVEIIQIAFQIDHALGRAITSLRILQFIQIGGYLSQEIAYAQMALFNAFAKMLQLSIFCVFILIIYGVFALKLLKGELYFCSGMDKNILNEFVKTKTDCLDYGGSWVTQTLSYDNIFDSINVLFVTATTEAWLPILQQTWSSVGKDQQPQDNYNRWWAIYFQFFFFIGNLCMLNMFIGLIVNTYQEGKLKAQNLHLLDETQREWFHIKLSIYKMKPLKKSIYPQQGFRKYLFFLIKNKMFKRFWLIIIALNTLTLSLQYHRQDRHFSDFLEIFNTIFLGIFIFEILVRFAAKEFRMYIKDNINRIDIFGVWFCIANLVIKNDEDINFYLRRVFNSFCVAFQLVRNYKIIKRFNQIEKLFSSIFSVIPSALSMMYIMFIFIFIYTNLGMDLFAYLREQTFVNGWDLHFRKFTTGMFSLLRVASQEQWWALLVDCAHTIQPDFHCRDISNYQEFSEVGFNGCGTKYAYVYYISFHLIFSLMILNVFIASVLGAYEEHVKSEESAISKYQLNDVLNLWVKYDPRGYGFINYKLFWKLSSEIAIIFGVDQADLLDVNNKKNFLKVLNIPIYENKKTNMLCYKFHDVILSLTKISVTLKYGVTNLEPTDKEIVDKLSLTFGNILSKDENFFEFRNTAFNSGDMVSIIYIQRKLRGWIKRVIMKDKNAIGEMSDINKMLKREQQQ